MPLRFSTHLPLLSAGCVTFSKEFFISYIFLPNEPVPDSEITYDEEGNLVNENSSLISFGMDVGRFSDFASALAARENDSVNIKILYYGDHRAVVFCIADATGCFDPESMNVSSESNDMSTAAVVTEYHAKLKQPINPVDYSAISIEELASDVVGSVQQFLGIFSDFSTEYEEIRISITEEGMTLSTVGLPDFATKIKLPNIQGTKAFLRFTHMENSSFTYKIACFKHLFKSMQLMNKICFQTFRNGLLKIQLLFTTVNEVVIPATFDYVLLPTVDEDD
jgi:hypothetical protein